MGLKTADENSYEMDVKFAEGGDTYTLHYSRAEGGQKDKNQALGFLFGAVSAG